jgi:ribosomal protein L40E
MMTDETQLKTKKCKYCQSSIPLEAQKCPKCQSDLRNWFRRHLILTILIALITIGLILSGDKKERNVSEPITPTQGTKKETSRAKIFKIGENVIIDGKTRWKVLSVENLGSKLSSTNPFIESKTTTGKFIKVRFEVENISKDLESVGNIGLIDSQGREYVPSPKVFFWIPDEEELFLIDNINPNITKTYTVIFEVAKDATGLKFRPGGVVILKDVFIDLGI